MSLYFKSLSGDIITISLSSISSIDLWNDWNRITSIIASENNCDDCQVVIFENKDDENKDEESDNHLPPLLVPERQYNFLIRDFKDFQDYFRINVTYLEKDRDEDPYNTFCIEKSMEQEVYRFCIYEEKKNEGNIYLIFKRLFLIR